jgi:uncharacterized iron-regulated membrane protein
MMKATTMNTLHSDQFIARLREWGPYLLAALLLPGGVIVALGMWLHQHYRKGAEK